jgi:hypothetical protein
VRFEQGPHRSSIESPIALASRSPDRRTLTAVEHAELNHGQIRRPCHDATKRVDLSNNSAFRNATNGRIARHLPDGLERTGDNSDAAAEARRRHRRLSAGVAGANHDDVKFRLGRESGTRHSLKVAGQAAIVHPCGAQRLPNDPTMPLELAARNPSLLIRRTAFERVGLTRAAIDERLGLTDQEFRVEGELIVVGPVPDAEALPDLIADLESAGLAYFDDYFDLSGNWPEWLTLFARDTGRATGA